MRTSGEDVLMMLQVDMVGYRKPGEPMQLARPDIIGLKEAGWFVGNVSGIYAPELVVGYVCARSLSLSLSGRRTDEHSAT
jgi:hypothetical protein